MPNDARCLTGAGPAAPGPAGAGRRRGALTGAFLALAGLFGACATTGSSQVQTDMDGIQQQLWKVQKDNAALADQIAQMRDAARGSAAVAPAPGLAPELRLRLETIERDLQVLRSRADDTDRRLSAAVEDLRATRESLQSLVQALPQPPGAGGAGAGAGAAPPVSGPLVAGAAAAPGMAPAGPPGAASPPAAGGTQPPASSTAGAATPVIVDEMFRQGYTDYSKGNYALALQELNEFVRRFPSSALADDAQFLIGEVQYAQRHFPEAIAAYDQLIQAYPGGDKAASAYLKKGLALLVQNNTAEAVIQLQHVVSAYPRSEEARIARERLRGLGLKER